MERPPSRSKVHIKCPEETIRQMMWEGFQYTEASNCLGRCSDQSLENVDYSSAQSILSILGMEIILKSAILRETLVLSESHDYSALWKRLDATSRDAIIKHILQENPKVFDGNSLEFYLNRWYQAFRQGRYYYEVLAPKTSAENQKLGSDWLEAGGLETEAAIVSNGYVLDYFVRGLVIFMGANPHDFNIDDVQAEAAEKA